MHVLRPPLIQVRSEDSTEFAGASFDTVVFEEPCFEPYTEQSQQRTDEMRIGIKPISFQLRSERPQGLSLYRDIATLYQDSDDSVGNVSTRNCSDAGDLKPDPPASRGSDSNFPCDFGLFSEEGNLDRFAGISIGKKSDSDRTVVSELTCDSFSDFVATRPDQSAFQLLNQPLKTQPTGTPQEKPSSVAVQENSTSVTARENPMKTEQQDTHGDDVELRSVRSHGSSKKMQELIRKFESLANSKVSLERCSRILRLQQQTEEGTVQTASSSVVVDIDTLAGPKTDSRDRGFFWRSQPSPQDTSDTCPDDSDIEPSNPDDDEDNNSAINEHISTHDRALPYQPKLVHV